jgi:hypothetical protein
MEEIYYTYAYLDDNNKPYYVGKGSGNRAYKPHSNVEVPKDKSKILFLKKNLSENKAIKHEEYMIHVLGLKESGGILENKVSSSKKNLYKYKRKFDSLGSTTVIRVPAILKEEIISIMDAIGNKAELAHKNGKDGPTEAIRILTEIKETLIKTVNS